MKSVDVFFNEIPNETDAVIAHFTLRVDSAWKDPVSKSDECDPTPFKEIARDKYPECSRVFANQQGEIRCDCGYDNVFNVYFCR